MAERERCPSCGTELPANAPQGLCPACLLRQGLDSEASDPPSSTPPSPPDPDRDEDVLSRLSLVAAMVAVEPGTDRALLRRLRADQGVGPGRHGGCLQGSPAQPEPAGRLEVAQVRHPGHRRRAAAVPERGRGGRAPGPPAHRADLRGGRARRPPVLQHEAGRRARAWRRSWPTSPPTRRPPRGW